MSDVNSKHASFIFVSKAISTLFGKTMPGHFPFIVNIVGIKPFLKTCLKLKLKKKEKEDKKSPGEGISFQRKMAKLI